MFQAPGFLSLVLTITLIWAIWTTLCRCYPVLHSWQKGTFWLLKPKPNKKQTVIDSCPLKGVANSYWGCWPGDSG